MKPANLTSTLLTRKGRAQPTLISPPRSAGQMTSVPPPSPAPPLWRAKEPARSPSTVAWHENSLADRYANAPRQDFDRRIHMSLRLDPGRHLRLRIEASRTGRSMQSLLLQALDEFLERDGPGTSGGHASHNGAHGSQDTGNRREPGQPPIGAETDGGSTQSR
jgi:hypothetical protein